MTIIYGNKFSLRPKKIKIMFFTATKKPVYPISMDVNLINDYSYTEEMAVSTKYNIVVVVTIINYGDINVN